MSRILVLGYFGYVTDQLDGQTVKTRNVFSLIKQHEQELSSEVVFFDTQSLKSNKFNVLLMYYNVLRANKIFYLGAQNNLKYFFPLVFLLSALLRKDLHYVVVGGWLVEFLIGKPLHRFMLNNIKAIYPQTQFLCRQLAQKYNLNNVYKLNNFRIADVDVSVTSRAAPDSVFRLVFMARVHPMKGVNVLFTLADKLKAISFGNVIIDIYGPIHSDYENKFREKLTAYTGIISYEGVLQPDNIYNILAMYDFMLFPTRYFTEGFPGSILDAYIAGIPVVVSRWKYAEEFVEENLSGLICDFNDDESFVSTVCSLLKNKCLMESLKHGAKGQAAKYSPETAWQILRRLI